MYQKNKDFFTLVFVILHCRQKIKVGKMDSCIHLSSSKVCQRTEVEFLLQKMRNINRHLSLPNNNSALQEDHKEKETTTLLKIVIVWSFLTIFYWLISYYSLLAKD